MKNRRINAKSCRHWCLFESHDCLRLFVTGDWEITIVWDDGGGDFYILKKFEGRDVLDEAYDAWYDLIGE